MNYITDCNCERGRNTETSKKKRAIPANYDIEFENEPEGYNCQQKLSQPLIDDMLVNPMKYPSLHWSKQLEQEGPTAVLQSPGSCADL